MSWSENRSSENDISKEKKTNAEDKQKLEHIRQINGVLKSFSNDEDLQDDLKLQIGIINCIVIIIINFD